MTNAARFALGLLGALVALVALVSEVSAHPMGNISVSHYAGIEIESDGVRVKYLLDFAEIPAVRELELVDPDVDNRVTPEEREKYLSAKTQEILPHLRLEVNGKALPLEAIWSRVTFPPGEGGLSTVRVAWELHTAWTDSLIAKNFLVWSDANYEDRPGWKEIRISSAGDLAVAKTSLRTRPTSGELNSYPQEYLQNPPTDTKAWCLFGAGLTSGEAAAFEPPHEFGGPRKKDRLVALLETEQLDPKVVLVSLLVAVLLGAAHALEPGHGKTIVGAYLVGSRGTVGQAALLGLVVTFTHTFSVLLLGVAVLFLSRHFVPEKLFPVLGIVSGLLIAVVGISMLRARWRELRGASTPPRHQHGEERDHRHSHAHGAAHDHGHPHDHLPAHAHPHEHEGPHHHEHPQAHEHPHEHEHPHDHGHSHGDRHAREHGHSHVPAERASLRSILALGISGGLVPCPAAIVVLLAAVALGRVAFGLLLIVAFSVGLAAVLVTVGILFVTARRLFDRVPASQAFVRRLGLVSAAFITLFGIALTIRSIVRPGL